MADLSNTFIMITSNGRFSDIIIGCNTNLKKRHLKDYYEIWKSKNWSIETKIHKNKSFDQKGVNFISQRKILQFLLQSLVK